MAQVKVRKAKITELVQDDRNLNKGTARGKELIQKSIGQFGAVRGVAVDKDNRIIAGNKTVENAVEQGIEEVIIVETTGKELVVTKRVDTSLDTKEGREMALADNATVKADLAWDTEELNAVAEDFGIDTEEWDVETINPNDYGEEFSLPDGERSEFCQLTFTLAHEQNDFIQDALKKAKADPDFGEYCGNNNENGNAIYLIVKQWAEQRR